MVFSSTRLFTAYWACVSLSSLSPITWLALLPGQVDAGTFSWPWLCDAVTEHYDRLKQKGGPRNVIGYHTIVGNFSYGRRHDRLHDTGCGDAFLAAAVFIRVWGTSVSNVLVSTWLVCLLRHAQGFTFLTCWTVSYVSLQSNSARASFNLTISLIFYILLHQLAKLAPVR